MKTKRIISYRANHKFKTVPFIRLSGAWLQSIGFNVGMHFILSADRSSIKLQLINSKENINDPDTSI